MTIEIKRKWEPLPNLTYNYGKQSLLDRGNSLEILLFERWTEDTLKIIFDGYLLYRNIDDSYYLNGPAFPPNFKGPWEFFIIENSKFKEWFKQQDAAKLCDPEEIIHYAIYTMDDCIDVLTLKDRPPKVELIC